MIGCCLTLGHSGPAVRELQTLLAVLGYPVPLTGTMGPLDVAVVRAFQMDTRLTVDGLAGPQTLAALRRETVKRASSVGQVGRVPSTAREAKFQRVLDLSQLAFDGRGIVYGGGVQHFKDGRWVVPLMSGYPDPRKNLVPKTNAWVCSTCTGVVLGYWLNANEDYTWRIGRSGAWQGQWSCQGRDYKKARHVGYAEYLEPVCGLTWQHGGWGLLWRLWDQLNHINLLEYQAHVVLVVKVDRDFGLVDPRTGLPARQGLYRFGADGGYPTIGGVKCYSAQKTTWRRCGPEQGHAQGWRIYRVAELTAEGLAPEVEGGLWHGNSTKPFVLEGFEDLAMPTLADALERVS